MSLTCNCPDCSGSDSWYYYPPKGNFELMPKLIRRKRCCSCRSFIDQGREYLRFERRREPKNDIEETIYGDDMNELMEEYWELTNFKKLGE